MEFPVPPERAPLPTVRGYRIGMVNSEQRKKMVSRRLDSDEQRPLGGVFTSPTSRVPSPVLFRHGPRTTDQVLPQFTIQNSVLGVAAGLQHPVMQQKVDFRSGQSYC